MTDTVNLALPCIEGSQAQKHVTHNDALRILDTLVQLAVLDRDLTAPPGTPAEGQRWIVKSGATGAWAGHNNAIAAWQDGAWQFSAPKTGWVAFVADEGTLLVWNGTAWGDFFSTVTSVQNLALLGVGTTADSTNPLSAKLNNMLLTAKTVAEGGDGNLRVKLNKESAAKTLSFLFQDNFSGRAEVGLTGDDDFHFKVTPDGSTWLEAILIDRSTGTVRFPSNLALPVVPQGRLSLASATPVMTSDQAAKTTVYYTPYIGQLVPIYNGSRFVATDIGGELSQTTTDTSKSPAAIAANSNYDVFVWSDGGTIRATRGPAWSSDTARGTGAGTTEMQRINGILTNKNAISNGPAANLGTYVGTIRSNGSSQIDWKLGSSASGGGIANLGVWNCYNRVASRAYVQDSTASWTYASATIRAADGGASFRVNFASGLAEGAIFANYRVTITLPTTTGGYAIAGHDIDSTTTLAHRGFGTNPTTASGNFFSAASPGYYGPSLGFHFISANEKTSGATATYEGGQNWDGLEVVMWN